MKCQCTGCKREATYEACLSIAADATHEPSKSTPIMYVCRKHIKNVPTFEEQARLINSNGRTNWECLVEAIISMGKKAPVKEHCKVVVEPIFNKVLHLSKADAN